MKKYLIKTTSTGTPENPNFAGVINHYWLGKGSLSNIDRDVFEEDSAIMDNISSVRSQVLHLAKEWGYNTERAAKIGLAAIKRFHDDESAKYGHHTFEHKVIAIEVEA